MLKVHRPAPAHYRLYAVGKVGGVPLSNPMLSLERAKAAGLAAAADAALAARVQEVVPGVSVIVLNDDQGHEVHRWPVLGVAEEQDRRPSGVWAMLRRWMRWE